MAVQRPPLLLRLLALIAVCVTLVLVVLVLQRLDARPRTHAAHLFAYTAGIAPEINGRIAHVAVNDQQAVREGDVLFALDSEAFELRVQQARAQREALEAQIALATRQVTAQTSGADAAATQIRKAEAQRTLAADSLRRIEPLLAKGYATQQQIDEARANLRSAEAALAGAQRQSDQAREAISDTESLRAQLRAARAAEALAQRDLRNTTVRAPFDGIVAGLETADGAFASAGHPLLTLVDTRRWYAIADFRETELPHMSVGDTATVWTMADGSRPMRGTVESLSPGVRPDSGGSPGLPAVARSLNWVVVAQRFPVRIALEAPPAELMRIGATASVRVER
jgi:multidrug efflux system membrane fusion protein